MHSALFMILVDRHQGLYRIKLCSPERGNALAVAMVNALQDAVDEAIADPNIHSLLLSSAGHHFCTGFDLSDLQNLSDQDCLDRLVAIETLLQSLWYAPLRSAALCEGRAWGAGADLLAVCDQAWLGTQATIRFPGVGFGLILGTRRLGSILGSAQAMRWLSNGYSVDQTQAIESGFGHAAPDTGAYEHLTEMLSQRPPWLWCDR
ncbi:MAG: enoyl-CoA hydratase/isomerase family protein [Betaproteobacteria bacterium]|nr:enoyl-CoA hydratase/isomerase family protein [Betaproteobacteria bacterium]